MTLRDAAEQIKTDWEAILPKLLQPAQRPENGKPSYICPFCGHGTHGNGLTYNPHSTAHGLSCPACGFSGSDIDLYMQMQGLEDYTEAVKELAPLDGLVIDEYERTEGPQTAFKPAAGQSIQPEAQKPVESPTEPQNDISAFINSLTPAGDVPAALEYLTGRGFTLETIERYKIKYNPAQTFFDKENNRKFTAPGVVFPYSGGLNYYNARSIDGKFFYKPNTDTAGPEPIFNKAALYNGRPCFICEGQIDALSILQAGGNAAACGGDNGYKKIVMQCKEKAPAAVLILCFDNDGINQQGHRPGQEAQAKLAEDLKGAGIPFIEAQFNYDLYNGAHKDANDLLRADPERLAAEIEANNAAAIPKSEVELFLDETYTQKYKGVATGIKSLDSLLNGGFIPQTLILLSAEPGAGKTALATEIWENIAETGHPCIYLNLEMSKQQMLARSIARRVYVKYDKDRQGTGGGLGLTALNILRGYEQTEATREKVRETALEFEQTTLKNLRYNPIAEDGNRLQVILDFIEAEAQRATEAGEPVPYICIDYLHIMTGEPGEDPAEMLKRAVFKFKEFAAKYDTIVFAIMAQGRGVNNSNRATMSAGRDTSGLEYTADLQMQLVRGEDGLANDEIALHITKSRFTQTTMTHGIKFKLLGGQSYLEDCGEFTPGNMDFDDFIESDYNPFEDDPGKGKGKRKRRKSTDKVQPAETEPQGAYIDNSDFIDFIWPDDPD